MSIKKFIGLREEMSIGFYLCDFLFRKVLRHNADVSWSIHFTSVIHGAARIKRGKGGYPGDSPNVFINADNGIEIGDYTNIGPGVALVSANHDFINNEINQWIKNLYEKYSKDKNLGPRFKYNIDVMDNYDIDTLIETSYKHYINIHLY